ncbi:hypothetical protein [Cellulomonas sp. NPDC058312]|uniref:hypothetical protein n=1 Tax=Cellulomonas sp. NPDC058312 TaxID=3346441 RepID=UPI0036E8717B
MGLDAAYDRDALASMKGQLAEWRQGDLIDSVPYFWASPGGADPLTELFTTSIAQRSGVAMWDERAAGEAVSTDIGRGWAIVASQTCDVGATGPGLRHLTVQVHPVVEAPSMSKEALADAYGHRKVDLFPVSGLSGGPWFADLRVSFPVSKSLLALATPVRGFVTVEESHRFAQHLAAKVRRPALHDAVSDQLVPALETFFKRQRESDWIADIEQVRLTVVEGEPLWPSRVELLVVLRGELQPSGKRAIRDLRTQLGKPFKRATIDATRAPHGCVLGPVRFQRLEKLSVEEYRNSTPLRISDFRSFS